MPRSEAVYLPLEILIKGSISDLIKGTYSISTLPDPESYDFDSFESTPDEQSLLTEYRKDKIPAKDSEPNNNEIDSTIKNKLNTTIKQEAEKTLYRDKNNNSLGLINELKKLCYRRVSVRTQRSVYIDGLIAEVGKDFIIMITPQLSVVTIPLYGIVSFNIQNS